MIFGFKKTFLYASTENPKGVSNGPICAIILLGSLKDAIKQYHIGYRHIITSAVRKQ